MELKRLQYVFDTNDQYYLDEKLTCLKQVGESKFRTTFLSPISKQRWDDFDLGLSCAKCNTILNQREYNNGLFSDEIFIMCKNCTKEYSRSILEHYKKYD
mgnify:CR=1 FL=1|tara:strand:- start:1331 stop:1630 length:300 start_codon:yes stop_codon:yes gene_type:complete